MNRLIITLILIFSAPFGLANEPHQQGAKLFSRHCVLCHGTDGMGEGLLPLKVANYPPTNLLTATKAVSLESIVQVITKGVEANHISEFMPPWENELSPVEIEQLANFIVYLRHHKTEAIARLKEEIAQKQSGTEDGKIIFTTRCFLCHGETGEGNGRMAKVIQSPPPADLTASRMPDEYLRLIISEGGAGIGRSGQMPPWKDQLTEQEIRSVVNYIKTLRD